MFYKRERKIFSMTEKRSHDHLTVMNQAKIRQKEVDAGRMQLGQQLEQLEGEHDKAVDRLELEKTREEKRLKQLASAQRMLEQVQSRQKELRLIADLNAELNEVSAKYKQAQHFKAEVGPQLDDVKESIADQRIKIKGLENKRRALEDVDHIRLQNAFKKNSGVLVCCCIDLKKI
jgi:chromosome segregation ATPase